MTTAHWAARSTPTLAERVAHHVGAHLGDDGRMRCPVCGGDFGPTIPLGALAAYELGYLPGAPLLAGVCLDCGHVSEPTATSRNSEEEHDGRHPADEARQ